MRGKVFGKENTHGTFGITPAHAGKSFITNIVTSAPRDHPRTCGEKVDFLLFANVAIGSPPHMRGKGHNIIIRFHSVRITPAHAGKSC